MDGKVIFFGGLYKMFFPGTQLFPFPGRHSAFKQTESFIRDNKVGIYAQHLTKSFAGWAGAVRIIERKKIGYRFFKPDAIHFKPVRKWQPLFPVYLNKHLSLPFIESRSNGICQPVAVVFIEILYLDTVDQEE